MSDIPAGAQYWRRATLRELDGLTLGARKSCSDQFCQRHAEGSSDQPQAEDGRVSLPPLDETDDRAMQALGIAQLRLGEPAADAEIPNAGPGLL